MNTGKLLLYDPLFYDHYIYKNIFCLTEAFFNINITYFTTNPWSQPAVTNKELLRTSAQF